MIGLAASGAHYSGWDVTGLVALAYGGGTVVGLLAGLLGTLALRRLDDPLLHNAALVLVPFAAFLAAEQIHASGVIAVVIAGLYLSRTGPRSGTPPQSRQQRDGFWTWRPRGSTAPVRPHRNRGAVRDAVRAAAEHPPRCCCSAC